MNLTDIRFINFYLAQSNCFQKSKVGNQNLEIGRVVKLTKALLFLVIETYVKITQYNSRFVPKKGLVLNDQSAILYSLILTHFQAILRSRIYEIKKN